MILPIELFQVILEFSDFFYQIRLTQLNKYLHINLKIYDLYNIDKKYLKLLSNKILKNYKHIKKLNAKDNLKITDKGISHMNLHTLDATENYKITDKGISHMKLHTLYASETV